MSDESEAPVFEAMVTAAQLKKLADGLHAQLGDTETPTKVRLEVFAPDEGTVECRVTWRLCKIDLLSSQI